MKLYTDVNS